ncbi:flavin-containing monooxygenase [Corynebacterium nasicanis]|uniref:Flavin-containing monooxygenase n=1 Tax=Corynebacterium nasicanis TaxID=1448267 RepID=A0ABW1QAA1_9CORY
MNKDVIIIGAGVAGLYMLHTLRKQGLDVHIVDRAAGVGGTWYWNRYPGCRCDIESLDYSYSFDEALQQEWKWTEKYASQPEILAYLEHVAERFDLHRDISLNTSIDSAEFVEDTQRWRLTTSDERILEAKYVVMATGVLSAPKDPRIEGLEDFEGHVLKSASWPQGGVDFTGRRVALIGTGSTGIQMVPKIAEQAERLYVLQRTPSFSIPAHNRPLSDAEQSEVKSSYADFRRRARSSPLGVDTKSDPRSAVEVDAHTRESVFRANYDYGSPMRFANSFNDIVVSEEANAHAVDFVAERIRERVTDQATAEKLIPRSYFLATRRMCIDTDYYETFNQPNVELVDLLENPLERVDATGFVVDGEHIEVDDIVLATGFDAITGALSRIDIRGRDGRVLNERWADYPASFMGVMVHGFPNMFTITGPLSPSVNSNMFVTIEQHVEFIAGLIAASEGQGTSTVEVSAQAETDWCTHAEEVSHQTLFPRTESWYTGANIEGKPRVVLPYLGGVGAFDKLLDEQAENHYPAFEFA